jgi:predicted RNase H-like nuclease (RuvC/YqgF family)
VDRTFFYRHRDLLAQLHALEAQPAIASGVGPAVSRASLQADLNNCQARCARMDTRVRHVEHLKQQIITLEQQVIDLRRQLEERDEELDAARSANRELTVQLNRGPG